MTPQVFPPNDTSYLNFNRIGERATKIWPWTNEKGEILFVKWRRDFKDKETGEHKKVYLPVSRINNEWTNKQGWTKNLPLFKLPELLTTKKPILIVEGEKTCDSAQKLFPNYFVTTWASGCRNWHQTNWSVLRDKREIIFWPDNDVSGRRAVHNISRWICDNYNIQPKIVEVPSDLPTSWDLADYKEDEDLNIFELVANAEVVKKHNYEDIETDIEYKRWVYIKKGRKLYYDRFKKEFVHKDTVNDLYMRDNDLKTLATKRLQKDDCDVVEATAFWPINKEYIYEDGQVFLNTYKPKVFEALEKKPTKDDVKVFRDHLRLISNNNDEVFNWLEDTIAHDIQRPEVIRLWAVLLQGDFGLGKTVIFDIITQLMGEHNVEWVPSYAFSHRFRDWLKKCCVIVCNEFTFDKFNAEGSQAYQMMREVITEDKHFIESKGIDQYQHKGHYKIWLSSNDAVPIKLSPRDRRYFVVKINTTKDIILGNDPDYYKKLWALKEEDKLKYLYWYYKSVHKISNEFNPREPLMTEAKSLLIAESQSQIFRDLDIMFEEREGPFEFDIVNSNMIINYVRQKEEGFNGIPNPRSLINKIDQTKITEWISYRQGVPIKKGYPVSITPNDIERKKKARYHAIRNQDRWYDCENLELLRAHMNSKVKVAKKDVELPF